MDAVGSNLADTFIPGRRVEQIIKQMNAIKANIQRQRDQEAGIPNPPTIGPDPGGMKVPDDTTLPLLAASVPLGMIAPEAKGAAGLASKAASKAKSLPGNWAEGAGGLRAAIEEALGRAGPLTDDAANALKNVGPELNPSSNPLELFKNSPTSRIAPPAVPPELADTAVRPRPAAPVSPMEIGENLGRGNELTNPGRTLQNPASSQLDMFKGQAPKVPNDPNVIPPFKKSQGLSLDSLDNGYADTAVKPNFLEEELKSRVAKPKMSYAPKDFAQEIPMNGSEAPPFEPTRSMRAPKDLTGEPSPANLNIRGKPMVTEKNSAIAAGIAAALALPGAGYVANQAMHQGEQAPALPIGAVPGHPIEAIPLPSETPKAKARRPAKRPSTSGQPGEGPFKLDPFSGVEDMDYQNFSDMLRAGILSMKR